MILFQARMEKSGRKVVNISQEQVDSLAGNCYEVVGEDGRMKIIISTRSVLLFSLLLVIGDIVNNLQSLVKFKDGPEVCPGYGRGCGQV